MDIAKQPFSAKHFEKFDNFCNKINKYLYENNYFALLFLVSFVFWVTNLSIVGLSLMLLIGAVALIINKDVTPILPIFAIMVLSVSDQKFLDKIEYISVLASFGVLFGISLLFNFFYYNHKLKKGKLTVSLALISIALLFGGIGTISVEQYFGDALLFTVTLGLLMLVLYTYMISCMNVPEDVNIKRYFAKSIVLIAIIMFLQTIVAQQRVEGPLENHIRGPVLWVGWANRTGLGMMLTLTTTSALYLAETSKKYHFIWFTLSFLLYTGAILTCGRGAILASAFSFVVVVIYLLIKSRKRLQLLLSLLVWACIAAITLYSIGLDFIAVIMQKFIKDGTSGRIDLYVEAIRLFPTAPLFGVGLGYIGPNLTNLAPHCIYWFHDTVLQVLASMGLFGIVCYTIYYINKFNVLYKNKSIFNFIMALGVLSFELLNLIDAGTFEPFPFFFAGLLINTFVEYSNNHPTDDYTDNSIPDYTQHFEKIELTQSKEQALITNYNR